MDLWTQWGKEKVGQVDKVALTYMLPWWLRWQRICLQCRRTWVLIPGSGRSLGEGNGSPLQYFCLENSMDRGA